MADAMEPPKEDFSVGPLSVLSESVKKNCQVYTGRCGGMHVLEWRFLIVRERLPDSGDGVE